MNVDGNESNAMPVTGWSWGAAGLGWIWALGNHSYMPLIGLLPGANTFWWIVCGIYGHEWAFKNFPEGAVEEFNAIQRSWDRAGKIAFLVYLLLAMLTLFVAALSVGLTFSFCSRLLG